MVEKQQLFVEAKNSIVNQNKDKAVDLAKQGLDSGVSGIELLEKGFLPGISEVGELFGSGRLFLPELIVAGQTMEKVVEVINESLVGGEAKGDKGKVLIATVEGDVHDIGKTIVVSIFKANGFDVKDIGRDVPNQKILDEAEKFGADVIGTSALLTTTMVQQKNLEELLRKEGLREKYKTIVGGAPVTQRWAKRIGADAYAQDAGDGVKKLAEIRKD
ncbi:MAG: corrinoid protein [Desulfohalobiaceae bacterium]|nr:corrinoid protein [Desulfohalobiaceae bacterium]